MISRRETIKTQSFWVKEFIKKMPELLAKLCAKESAASLERLQLVSIAIDLLVDADSSDESSWQNVSLVLDEGFLILSGDLYFADEKALKIAIKYFMRKERKFYKSAVEAFLATEDRLVSPIDLSYIEEFFAARDMENNFLYDVALSRLNGRPQPQVHSLIVMDVVLHHVLVAMRGQSVSAQHFALTFHNAVWPDRVMKFVYARTSTGLHGELLVDEGRAVFVKASTLCRPASSRTTTQSDS